VWTVDQEADLDRCLELGVEGIISNRPAFAREYIFGKG
jgi:glycerophosphoryl diester phosphodiesterase